MSADNILRMLDADADGVATEAADYRLQDQVGFLLRKAHQRHIAIFTSRIVDLTPPQFAALAALADAGETSQNQLGAMVAMDAATIKGVIDRLGRRGLVEMRRDEDDRRRLMVRLTPQGRTALGGLLAHARQITAETLSPLTQREAQQLARLLGKIG